MKNTIKPPAFRGLIGIARRDVTPPDGVYSRCWGAAAHEVGQGVHRPLTATALVIPFLPNSAHDRETMLGGNGMGARGGEAPSKPKANSAGGDRQWLQPAGGAGAMAGSSQLVILALDGTWWQSRNMELRLRQALANAIGYTVDQVMTCLSHTHSGVPLTDELDDVPGGTAAQRWFEELLSACAACAREALAQTRPAMLEWTNGRCSLARQRDQQEGDTWLVGCNIEQAADETLLVGRITTENGQILATVVNYACHPTTLAWANQRWSPDWPGAMREIVEAETAAPCLFLQGAGGDLAPAEQYSADVTVADRHGRGVGHAVCAALASLPCPGMQLAFTSIQPSGAPLAVWSQQPVVIAEACATKRLDLLLPLRTSLESLAEIDAALAIESDPALVERLRRRRRIRVMVGSGSVGELSVWCWRLGDTLIVAVPAEAYSAFQQQLRAAFPQFAVVCINHGNGGSGYLIPADHYDRPGFYPAWQTPFAAGSFERLYSETLTAFQHLTVHEEICI